jgi:hypothetical protein
MAWWNCDTVVDWVSLQNAYEKLNPSIKSDPKSTNYEIYP